MVVDQETRAEPRAPERAGSILAPGRVDSILSPGRNVWRVAEAGRAAVLQDGSGYYAALRCSMRAARRSILIIGWDIDSRTALLGDEAAPGDGLPPTLGPFLSALAMRRPELSIRLLLWDYSVLYMLERELLPVLGAALEHAAAGRALPGRDRAVRRRASPEARRGG